MGTKATLSELESASLDEIVGGAWREAFWRYAASCNRGVQVAAALGRPAIVHRAAAERYVVRELGACALAVIDDAAGSRLLPRLLGK